jgi:hypothetical protein
MLQRSTPLFSPRGASSFVPPPPWHYCGAILSFAWVKEAAAQAFLPGGFVRATGRGFGHFRDWQATTDGSELLDPLRTTAAICDFALSVTGAEEVPA